MLTRRFRPSLAIALPLFLLAACQQGSAPLPTLAPLATVAAATAVAVATAAPAPTLAPLPTSTLPPLPSATLVASPTATTEATAMATASPTVPPVTPTPAPPPNFVFIVVDSVRADHISSYGYARPTTPNLDSWVAAQGVQFTQAIASASWTCPSNAAMFTGRIPSSLGATWATVGNSVPQSANTVAEYLGQAGYYAAGFISNSCMRGRNGFAQGFHFYDESFTERQDVDAYNQVDAEEMNDKVLAWLEGSWQGAAAGRPLFLFIYYMDPHVVYDPPPPYDTLYDPDYDGPFSAAVFGVGQEVLEGTLVPTPRDVHHIQALYDGEITYWDAEFGRLMSSMEQMGLLANTVVVVTADHGDMFGEHGAWVHGTSLYEGVIRVPMLIRYAGVLPPGRVDAPVQLMDLMPTVLNLAGFQEPEGLDAVSLLPLMRGEEVPARDIFSEVDAAPGANHWAAWIAPDTNLRSVQRNGWKLIHHVGDEASDELYHLHPEWPYEGQNVLAAESPLAAELRQLLLDWFER